MKIPGIMTPIYYFQGLSKPVLHYSDWVCTAVKSNDVIKDLRG